MNFKMKNGLKAVSILSNDKISPDVYVLKFKREFSFIAGQVISIALQIEEQPRMYSIASGTQDDDVWILYNVKPGGELTPEMAKLKPGDSIYISGPEGNFYGTAKASTWIASGTGIAPFVSMWRSGLKKDKILIHGGRFLHSFYFEEEFKDTMGEDFIRCCSQESGEGVYPGRLTQWLKEQSNLPTDRKYYLCGSAEMVVETRDILIEKGIPFENIVAEIYF
jgi:ferredoxin--NADP+ reductase